MEIRKAEVGEVKEIIKVMIESGEWDEWKLSYLEEDWKTMISNLEKIIEDEDLGIVYVIEKNDKIIGAVPLVRTGSTSLLFTCAGIIEKYKKDALTLLDRELFEIIPSEYKIIMNYARPTSKGAVPRFLKKNFGIKDNKTMFERWNELPGFIKNSIKLSPIYCYMEKRIEKKREHSTRVVDINDVKKEISKFIASPEFLEVFDIENRDMIEKLYRKYGLQCEIKAIEDKDSLILLMNYPFGITPSGYTSAAYFWGRNFENLIEQVENYYSSFNYRRVLCFVEEDKYYLLEKRGFSIVKPLQQIFYFVPENRSWRRKYKELL